MLPNLWQGAVAALGELANRKALPLFRSRLLQDPDAGVRSEAAFRLGKLGTAQEIPPLRSAATQDSHPMARIWAEGAVHALTQFADFD